MIDLDDLKAFVEVVESGGFNRAASRMGISKSIVSRRISRMEADLGVRLLSRTTRGISPTEAGLEFKARGERVLADLDAAREAVAQQGGSVVGRLRLTAPLSFGVRYVAPVLADLAQQHPKLELDVSYSDRLTDLIAERFDVAIRIGALKDSSLIARRVSSVRPVLVASPDYLARKGRPRTPAELAGHDCLIYTGSTVGDWQFRSGKRSVTFRPEGRLHSDSGDANLQWAIAGLGITEVPSFLAADAIEDGKLEPILLDHVAIEFGIYAIRPPGAYVPGKVRVLIDTLVERFGTEPDWDRRVFNWTNGGRKRRPARTAP